jgi:hypothetical protein
MHFKYNKEIMTITRQFGGIQKMMKYGAEPMEHTFTMRCTEIERRGQWVDVFLSMQLAESDLLPNGLDSPNILVICAVNGDIVQIVLQDEGCDSEFQFTYTEKEQIERFVNETCRPLLLIQSET